VIVGAVVALAGLVMSSASWAVLVGGGDSDDPAPQPEETVMPHVVGLTTAEALLEIRRAGIPSEEIAILSADEPSALPGHVIKQEPAAGAEVDEVRLTVAVAIVRMPAVAGLDIDDAIEVLAHLGIGDDDIVVQRVHSAGTPRGAVVWHEPATGDTVVHEVRLGVAR